MLRSATPSIQKYLTLAVGVIVAIGGQLSAQEISPAVREQIVEILDAKQRFTAGQQKLESNLAFAQRTARGDAVGRKFASSLGVVTGDNSPRIVDISGDAAGIVVQIQALKGEIISQFPEWKSVRARLTPEQIEVLAASPQVRWIAPMEKPRHNVGSLSTQGVISHSALSVIDMGFDGSGVKIGVLSDSASAAAVAARIGALDLGLLTTVLPGQDGGDRSDEGVAMMEIIQDLAPGAQLYFATADGGQAQMAANITALAQQGCSIIVDDATYLAEPAFQDGPIAQAVNAFVQQGGLYFSSAGNFGNLSRGTSGTWEGDFVAGQNIDPAVAGLGQVHSFGATSFNPLTGLSAFISLKWSDPVNTSMNDYDLFVVNSTGNAIKAFSANVQAGSGIPFEAVVIGTDCGTATAAGYCPEIGDQIIITRQAGAAARALRLETHGGRLGISTAGSTFGHNAAGSAISVGAVNWNSAKTGTKPFTTADRIEEFSSDGPRRIFFQPNGTEITPGNLLFATNGGTNLQKPDLASADGVTVNTPDFLPFIGTSAAAPHAAAIAALVKSAKPQYTSAQVRAALQASALDIMEVGVDRNSGVGLIMASKAIEYALSH